MKTNHEALGSLSLVSGYLYRVMRYEARNLGLRWTALMVLKDLSLLGACSQRLLARIEQITEPSMSALIRQLLKNGWVTRKTDVKDGRIRLISITAKGKKELARASDYLQASMAETLGHLSKRELDNIEKALLPVTRKLAIDINRAKRNETPKWLD